MDANKEPWMVAAEQLAVEISELIPRGVSITISVGTVLIKDARKES